MFKTIFSKLIAVFISILLIGFSITGIMLYFFLDNFVSQEKVQRLSQSAEKINGVFNIYLENRENPLAGLMFERTLDSYSVNTDSYIWIVDRSGNILFSSPEIPDVIKPKLKSEYNYAHLPDERQYKKVMNGQFDIVKETGDFYGLFKDTGVSWLTIEKPFSYRNVDGEQNIIAAVYLNSPMPEIKKARSVVFRMFIFSVCASIVISFILIYFFSLRISRPLKEINSAARIIAGGEFKRRLNINSRDEIGELANTFNQMVVSLQNLEDMRREFIANVSHELRTPMTSVRGFIEAILDGTIPQEKEQEYLKIVRDEINRLNRLVNDLLDLARMESGEITLNFKDFEINELLRICIIKLESLINEKSIKVDAVFCQEDLYVNADKDAIERVVLNLLHNSIKFTEHGGRIVIETYQKKDKVIVCIKDSGLGIDKDEINQIWDRFYKSDKSRSKDKGGTGLGLSIVKNIINEHKQDIWVDSEVGTYTKFTFTLKKVLDDELNC